VVERLRREGLDVITDVADARDKAVAITAHGVGPDVIRGLQEAGAEIVDGTCPIVTRSQQWAKKLTEEGYGLVVFGDPDHKEMRGVLGWASGKVMVVPAKEEPGQLPADFPSRIGVLSQTTETEQRFSTFVKQLLERNMERISELRVINTLCHATTSQQAATMELAAGVDLMIVVGGRESANTRHLADVSRECGVETYHIERAEEIEAEWLRGHERVGITAGASTPDSAVDEVARRLHELAALVGA